MLYKKKFHPLYTWIKKKYVRLVYAYSVDQLKKTLIKLGVCTGDSLLIHSSFKIFSGFTGSYKDLIDLFLEVIGTEGTLAMPSMTYLNMTSFDFLKSGKTVDLRRSVSKMGLISEVFRRREKTLRSIHPTHPMAAYGMQAKWFIYGHEQCLFPCGKGSPFEKLHLAKGKILFFDAPFNSFTFIHYLEDLIKEKLPFKLYTPDPIEGHVIDFNGNEHTIKTYVFNPSLGPARIPFLLQGELKKRKKLKYARIGRTLLMLVDAVDAVECAQEMASNQLFFYRLEDIR